MARILVLLIPVAIIVTVFLLSYKRSPSVEQFESCELSDDKFNTIRALAADIKNNMNGLKDYPWRKDDLPRFKYMYMVIVTRLQYMIQMYGKQLAYSHAINMLFSFFENKMILDWISNISTSSTLLFSESLRKYAEIVGMLFSHSQNNECPICDTFFIKQSMERLDRDFRVFIANTMDVVQAATEPSQRRILDLELRFYRLTKLVELSIKSRDTNPYGILDIGELDLALNDLRSAYLLVAADSGLGTDLIELDAFVDSKEMMIQDLKRCVVVPIIYTKCDFKGGSASLGNGTYTMADITSAYGFEAISSAVVPNGYSIVLELKDGSMQKLNGNTRCIPSETRPTVAKIIISGQQNLTDV